MNTAQWMEEALALAAVAGAEGEIPVGAVIVDREGRIRYKHVGPLTQGDIERTILPLVAKLER